jgi:hypothetical protein
MELCGALPLLDLRALLRLLEGREQEHTAAIFDSQTLPSSPESGHRVGYDGAKKRKGTFERLRAWRQRCTS